MSGDNFKISFWFADEFPQIRPYFFDTISFQKKDLSCEPKSALKKELIFESRIICQIQGLAKIKFKIVVFF